MAARNGDDPQDAVQRLEALIRALDAHPDRVARETARELLALVLDLHGLGLAKLMGIVSTSEGGQTILARLVEDKQVQSMLLLHGLHPEDFQTRVRKAVDRLHPHVGVHGLRLDVVEITNGTVRLRLHRCGATAIDGPVLWSLPSEIEGVLVEAAPDIETIQIEGLDLAETGTAIPAAV
jgi:acyl CoA:acetate/3-ketoacid CoA transferase alpha subunit